MEKMGWESTSKPDKSDKGNRKEIRAMASMLKKSGFLMFSRLKAL